MQKREGREEDGEDTEEMQKSGMDE